MGVPVSVRAVVGVGSAVFVIEGAHVEITAVDLHRAAVRVGVGLLVADLYPVEGAAGEHPAGARFVVPTRNALAEVGVGPQLEVRPHGDRLVAGLIALRGEAAGAAGEIQGVDAGGGCVIAGVHRIGIFGGQVHHSAAADADNAVLVITRAQIKGDGVGVDRHRTAGDGDAVIPGVDTVAAAVGGVDGHRAAGDADAGKARLVGGIAGDPVIGIGQRDIGAAAHRDDAACVILRVFVRNAIDCAGRVCVAGDAHLAVQRDAAVVRKAAGGVFCLVVNAIDDASAADVVDGDGCLSAAAHQDLAGHGVNAEAVSGGPNGGVHGERAAGDADAGLAVDTVDRPSRGIRVDEDLAAGLGDLAAANAVNGSTGSCIRQIHDQGAAARDIQRDVTT